MKISARDGIEALAPVAVSFNLLYRLTGRPSGLLPEAFRNAAVGAATGGSLVTGFVYAAEMIDDDDDLVEDTVGYGAVGAMVGGLVGLVGTLAWKAFKH